MGRPGYHACAQCGAEVLVGVDPQGCVWHLDTTQPTYVVQGITKKGVAELLQSRGYVVHVCGEREAGRAPQVLSPSLNDGNTEEDNADGR